MNPSREKPHKYSHLTTDEEEVQSFIYAEEKDIQHDFPRKSFNSTLRKALPWLLHLLLFTAYSLGFICWKWPSPLKEGFDSLSDVPIEYETVKFFAGVGNDTSEFQGPSTPQTDASWAELLDVGPGLMWIDEETALKLPAETAQRRNGTGYAVALEMFHQLHCLDRIRILFYHPNRNYFDETPEIFKEHTEHCFDYLRQTLMCHGDVGMMSMNWDENVNGYTAKFDVEKKCRKFDKIKNWTKAHQTGWWPTHEIKDER